MVDVVAGARAIEDSVVPSGVISPISLTCTQKHSCCARFPLPHLSLTADFVVCVCVCLSRCIRYGCIIFMAMIALLLLVLSPLWCPCVCCVLIVGVSTGRIRPPSQAVLETHGLTAEQLQAVDSTV